MAERAKSSGYGKFLKFSFLKLLKMHLRLHGTTTMLALVAYSLKHVKLLGPCKRTQHCWPTTPNNVGSCWHLLWPFIYSTCAKLLFDYKELGLNANHTDFCGKMQLIEEIINHKAQPQGNSPLSTGFYYQKDCLKFLF